jgi:hypothetical protein
MNVRYLAERMMSIPGLRTDPLVRWKAARDCRLSVVWESVGAIGWTRREWLRYEIGVEPHDL